MIGVYFNQLGNTDYNFSKITVIEQKWSNNQIYTYLNNPRLNFGLAIIKEGTAIYTLKNRKKIFAKKGDIVFLPMNANYMVKFNTEVEKATTILFNFILTDSDGKVINILDDLSIIVKSSSPIFLKLFEELSHLYNNTSFLNSKFKIKLYKFFDQLCEKVTDSNVISAGIDYINNNLHSDLSIEEISKMCAMSETTFRNKFKKQMGTTPAAYINNTKIEKAKDLLLYSDLSLEEISNMLNFYDSTYFCKIFKSITKMTTTEFKRQNEIKSN